MLAMVADLLRSNPHIEIVKIIVYTGAGEDESDNHHLSQARANRVKTILMQQGVEGKRLEAEGRGSSDEARVEMKIIKKTSESE